MDLPFDGTEPSLLFFEESGLSDLIMDRSSVELQTPCHTDVSVEGGLHENLTEGAPQGAQEFSLPPVDRGKDAWLFLMASFVTEALVWGE